MKALIALFLLAACSHAPTREPNGVAGSSWMDRSLPTEQRTTLLLNAMKPEDKLRLVFGAFSNAFSKVPPPPEGRPFSAGFVPGVPALGIPNQWETDAGLGVASQINPHPRERTSLPSGLATAATWNRTRAYEGGRMIGHEARLSGFNVQLAGGVNLMREPRNGRNFEYAGEDPWLAGTIVGEEIRGIQSNHIISTMKHFAINDQETNRQDLDVVINEASAQPSDLLAMKLAVEIGDPGSVMCAYNEVNGVYACENKWLLNDVLKRDWNYQGYVMSDWGAVHSTTDAANNGLDQESAALAFDDEPYFQKPLRDALAAKQVPVSRVDDMARRIVRQMFAKGVMDDPVATTPVDGAIDFVADGAVSQADAEESIVLLKNTILPLTPAQRIAIIGGHADVGVLSGGGSSQVYPVGGSPVPNEGPKDFPGPMVYERSSPLENLKSRLPGSQITYDDGTDLARAKDVAAHADIAIVFATQWTAESVDAPSLALPGKQNELISQVAKANGRTVVVLETGGPVTMPWLSQVAAVVEAWYPGTSGGAAIARVLTGEVNPSGHLPATFPQSEAQLPRKRIDKHKVDYNIEGAAVGYKWFDRQGLAPLFPFGFGLSYTDFNFANFKFDKDVLTFSVKNVGARAGAAVPQIYVSPLTAKWEAPQRLAAYEKVTLAPGEERAVSVKIDPRLLSVFDAKARRWKILEGDYELKLATSSRQSVAKLKIHWPATAL